MPQKQKKDKLKITFKFADNISEEKEQDIWNKIFDIIFSDLTSDSELK